MHPKAEEKIAAHVQGCLKNTSVSDGWPAFDSLHPHVASLANEICKHKKRWLSVHDVYSIYYDRVNQALDETTSDKDSLQGKLSTVLDENEYSNLSNGLCNYLSSIPRTYDVYLPLTGVNDVSPIEISSDFGVEVFSSENEVPGEADQPLGLLGFTKQIQPNQTYLRTTTTGYCGSDLVSNSLQVALTDFKVAIQQLVSKRILKFEIDSPSGIGLFASMQQFSVPKYAITSVDRSSPQSAVRSASLPIEVCRFIHGLQLNSESEDVRQAFAQHGVVDLFQKHLRLPCMLLANTEPEADQVKAAAEWVFDSYTNENSTVAFLQVCIGLEAILGGNSASESLTQTLADRCAYLAAVDIKTRNEIRERFLQLYKVRSKLVHGTKRQLDKDQVHIFEWGKGALELCIFREIRNLLS